MRAAILNDKGVLIGAVDTDDPDDDAIDCGDLPVEGTYFWDGEKFIPVGHGHGKPTRPPVDRDRAVYLMMRSVISGAPVPQECIDWCDWYERFNGLP